MTVKYKPTFSFPSNRYFSLSMAEKGENLTILKSKNIHVSL